MFFSLFSSMFSFFRAVCYSFVVWKTWYYLFKMFSLSYYHRVKYLLLRRNPGRKYTRIEKKLLKLFLCVFFLLLQHRTCRMLFLHIYFRNIFFFQRLQIDKKLLTEWLLFHQRNPKSTASAHFFIFIFILTFIFFIGRWPLPLPGGYVLSDSVYPAAELLYSIWHICRLLRYICRHERYYHTSGERRSDGTQTGCCSSCSVPLIYTKNKRTFVLGYAVRTDRTDRSQGVRWQFVGNFGSGGSTFTWAFCTTWMNANG